MDIVILKRGQITRTTPALESILQASAPRQRRDSRPPIHDLTYNRPAYTMGLQWNRVSSLKPSGFVVGTLPQGNMSPKVIKRRSLSKLMSN
ncbi:hypothetical protein AVEN_190638-1 [Araneus ventricosus]|uniref:Uncharacterized protein n=1 Tax=Araneus ventricosus TaxID=182803 RepID=A0A4Y2I1K6_ARAVE|nr:hypothetical protein AVEN_190638-1 [Araneus ventricosus]